MTVPYTVLLVSSAGRFSLSAVRGNTPDRSAPMVLADGLTFTWETTDSRIPGTFEPSAVSFAVACLDASSLDAFRVGERFQFWLLVGSSFVIQRTFTIADVEVDLDPHRRRKAHARITGVDGLAELRSRFSDPLAVLNESPTSTGYGKNVAAVAAAAGFKLYAPGDMFDILSPSLGRPVWPGTPWPSESVDEALAQVLDSGPWTANLSIGADRHLTILPAESAPTGYTDLVEAWYGSPPVDPVGWNTAGYVLVPHDRKQSGIAQEAWLPLAPTAEGGLTGSGSTAALPYIAAVDACHVEAPATGRRGRGSGFTTVIVSGQSVVVDAEGEVEVGEGTAQLSTRHRSTYGTISREVRAFALVKAYNTDLPQLEENVARTVQGIAEMFLSPEEELATATELDAFLIRLSDMEPAEAEGTILGLTPAPPASFGTQTIHRSTTHAVIYNLPADIFPSTRYWGHVVAGELTIDGGEMTYSVVLMPGSPELVPTVSGPPPAHRYTDSLGALTYAEGHQLTYTELQLTRRSAV